MCVWLDWVPHSGEPVSSQKQEGHLLYCGGFVSERDLNGNDEAQTHNHIFTKEVACEVKVEHKSFWLDILKKFSKATEMLYLDVYVGAELCSKALTLIAATKINWFQTNHHTDQGTPVHFIQKDAQTIGQDLCDRGNITGL